MRTIAYINLIAAWSIAATPISSAVEIRSGASIEAAGPLAPRAAAWAASPLSGLGESIAPRLEISANPSVTLEASALAGSEIDEIIRNGTERRTAYAELDDQASEADQRKGSHYLSPPKLKASQSQRDVPAPAGKSVDARKLEGIVAHFGAIAVILAALLSYGLFAYSSAAWVQRMNQQIYQQMQEQNADDY